MKGWSSEALGTRRGMPGTAVGVPNSLQTTLVAEEALPLLPRDTLTLDQRWMNAISLLTSLIAVDGQSDTARQSCTWMLRGQG